MEEGTPSPWDIAFCLSRIFRFMGCTIEPWSIAQHSLAVADLLPMNLRIHGLLHDAAEAVIGDIPHGFKTNDMRTRENLLLERIYGSLGLTLPNDEASILLKAADEDMANAELQTFCSYSMRIAEISTHRRVLISVTAEASTTLNYYRSGDWNQPNIQEHMITFYHALKEELQ